MRAVFESPLRAPSSKSAHDPRDREVREAASSWRRIARSIGAGQRLAAGAALGLWLGDVVMLARERWLVGWTRWLTGIGAALFVALTTALVVGALLGLVLVPVTASVTESLRAWWRRLREGGSGSRHAFAAQLLAVVGLVGAASWVSYRVALSTELGFSGPRSMAAAATLSHLAFVAALAAALPWSLRAARRLVVGASRVPGLRWALEEPGRLPVLFAAGALGAGLSLAVAHRTELAVVPWEGFMPVPGMVLGVAAAHLVGRARARGAAWSRGLIRALLALEVLCLSAGAAAAVRLHPESTTMRRLAFDHALSGRLGYAAWTAAFDFDGDGQLSMLGGGDCAPFDPRRYAGAIDIPGNGIDEDCDGTDLRPLAIVPRPRMRVGQDTLPARPSIVLVTVDALAAPRLTALGGLGGVGAGGGAGGGEPLMPNIDRLADRSMLFAHCFSEGPSTRLSFPAMFTSRWDSQLTHLFAPVHPYPLAPSERQLQDLLNEAGYETVAVIPDAYFGATHWSSITRGFQHVDGSAIAAGKFNSGQVTDAALRALAGASPDVPIYLWVHYYDAHGPYAAPPGMAPGPRTEERLYEAELTYIDRALAPLIAAVEARHEPTYLIFTADHATVFHPDPSSRRGHYGYDLYTSTLHVPLLVRGPRIPAGRVDGIVSTMDIVPTIADLVRLPSSPSFQGTSLLPEMLAAKGDPNRVLFHEFYLPERGFRGEDPLQLVSVRTSRYNLVLDRTRGMYELYDVDSDYFERHDLYEDQARAPEVLRMRSLLSSFVLRFHDRWAGNAGAFARPAVGR
jgi:choline-sulfatase